MKDILENVATQQAALVREPESSIVFRDMMLRLYTSWLTDAHAGGFPDAADGDGVAQCPIDMVFAGAYIYRVWSSDKHYMHIATPTNVSQWQNTSNLDWAFDEDSQWPDGIQRMSLVEDGNYARLFYGNGGTLYWTDFIGYEDDTDSTGSVYTVDDDHIAFAAVSDSVCYSVELQETGDFKQLVFKRTVTSGSKATCPYTVIVDADYNESSLQWFDAETLGDKDVLIFNSRSNGLAMVILYEHGVWGNPFPLLPMDVLDDSNYIRVSAVNRVADEGNNDVLWATGRISRGGSTGTYAQEYDIAMRSRDGEHWTLDRYSYLCSTEQRGKLIPNGEFVYYPGGLTVMKGVRTWQLGGYSDRGSDCASIEREVEDDIISWDIQVPPAGSAHNCFTKFAAQYALYQFDTEHDYYSGRLLDGDGDMAIFPGLWLYRSAGYNGYQDIISVEGVDQCPGDYKAGARAFSIRSRDVVFRMLYDWASSQDWQWLSQSKHYDDCDQLDHLYSISAGQITVKEDETDGAVGTVEEDEVEEISGTLVFEAPNRTSINLSTVPTEVTDFRVAVRFSITDDNPVAGLTDGNGYKDNTFLDGTEEQGTVTCYSEYIQDTGQDFTPYASLAVTGGELARRKMEDDEESRYCIAVVHTDGTYSWGWLDEMKNGDTQVYIRTGAEPTAARGWLGADPTAKTPSDYGVYRSDRFACLGTGVGVVGCATDQWNLIAAMPDLVQEKIWLLIRRGDEDNAIWLPWAAVDIDSTPAKGEIYELEMRRNGDSIFVQMFTFASTGSDRTAMSSAIEETWPLDEPMVVITDDAYNQTDRGKVGIIANISVPMTEIMTARSDREFVVRDPSLFRPTTYEGNTVYDDGYSSWQDFKSGYTWGGSSWSASVANANIPPLYMQDEVYDPVEDDPGYDGDNHFSEQWGDEGEEEGEIYRSTQDKWAKVKISPTDRALPYDGGIGGGEPPEGNDDGRYQFAFQYVAGTHAYHDWWQDHTYTENNMCPMFMVGLPHSASDHRFQPRIQDEVEMVQRCMKDEGVDFHYLDDMGMSKRFIFKEWYKTGGLDEGETPADRFPNFVDYPGFWLPGRGSPQEPADSHSRGTRLLQHWSPQITIHGVWAYDGHHDKTLEWVLKDIATKAGILYFDTEYMVNDTGLATVQRYAQDIFGSDLLVKDFDLTLELSEAGALGTSEMVDCFFRHSSKKGSYAALKSSLSSWCGVRLSFIVDGSDDVWLKLYQTNDNESGWILVDYVELPSSYANARTIRIVAHGRFFTVYLNKVQCPTLSIGAIYGYDTDGWDDSLLEEGYVYITRDPISANDIETVTMPELWMLKDVNILDSRNNAVAGLQRAIEDLRVKFISTLTYDTNANSDRVAIPTLRMSFASLDYQEKDIDDYPHYLGPISDFQDGDAGFPSGGTHASILEDHDARTDRIPTYVRVIGAEICDLVHHIAAAKYGLNFVAYHCPSLDEREAYREALRIVRDAISHAGGHKPVTAAQVNWEPEDILQLVYDPHDTGPGVDDYYIIDSLSMSFARAQFTANVELRELTAGGLQEGG